MNENITFQTPKMLSCWFFAINSLQVEILKDFQTNSKNDFFTRFCHFMLPPRCLTPAMRQNAAKQRPDTFQPYRFHAVSPCEVSMGPFRRGRVWWLSYMAEGKQVRESSRSGNKRLAESILAKRKAEILEGRWGLPRSDCPRLQQWADEVITRVAHGNTRDRYSASAKNLIAVLGNTKLSEITAERIEQFQQARLQQGKHPATVNRDTALLFRLLKLARKRRLVLHNACEEVERLNERRLRRQGRPLTYEDERRLLAHCDALLTIFVIVLIGTGLRSKKEGLPLKWADVDLQSEPGCIVVRKSKTTAGERRVWLTEFCRQQLQSWREFRGPQYSEYVFPSPRDSRRYCTGYQKPWKEAVTAADLGDRRVYDLRSTFATRVNAARATDLTLAHLLGHSSTAILPTYAKALDENMRTVIAQLDAQRAERPRATVVH